ncbi:MAG TPA: hypothetical protein VLJ57_22310 [Burkholderiaceae bacterium]|nr:hypothetical protein [Burkholderiaceae bacterium]
MFARASLVAACLAATAAAANPALTGTWNGTLQGNPLSLTLDGKGGGRVDGRPIRYQVTGSLLVIEDQGELAAYQFQVQGNQMQVAGGQLPGVLTLTRGQPGSAKAAITPMPTAAGPRQELVGKWCKASSFTANAGGGSQSSACFELRANGTYVYGSERSASAYGGGMWGGTSSNSGDAGRWSATEVSITAQSNSGRSSTYRLEKRNHPKNRDPMLCLDGECYVTFWQKAPW